jgi:hypothetical protein
MIHAAQHAAHAFSWVVEELRMWDAVNMHVKQQGGILKDW